jgi:predicted dienelactone hydrolase
MRSVLAVLLVAACSSNPSGQSPGDIPDANGGGSGGGGGSGSGSGSGGTTSGDPANDGPDTYASAEATINVGANRNVQATVFTPTSSGSHALVVISPGFQMARTQYTSYAKHLASWGFEVILETYAESGFSIDHAKVAADIKGVIDWGLMQPNVDATRIAVAGHSLGGKLSTFAASLDARIKAVVGWDPVDSNNPSVVPEKMSSIHAAVAVIGETTNGTGGIGGMSCAPSADNFQQFYMAAGSPAYKLTVAGADHMDWLDNPNCGFTCSACTAGTAAPELSRKATRRLNVAWLRRYLFDDTAMDMWLDSPPDAGLTVQRH